MYVVLTEVKKGNGLAFGDETHFFAVLEPVSDTWQVPALQKNVKRP